MRTVLVLLAILVIPALAQGHDGLVRSTPAQGARLAALPATAALVFGAPIGRITAVTVRDRTGVNRARSVRRDPRNARRILIALNPGPRGAYGLRWRILAADGHAQAGIVRFAVR